MAFYCFRCKNPLYPGHQTCSVCGMVFDKPVPEYAPPITARGMWSNKRKVVVIVSCTATLLSIFALPSILIAKTRANNLAAIINPVAESINSDQRQDEVSQGKRFWADSVEWPYHGHVTQMKVVLEPLWNRPVEYGGESKEWLERHWVGHFVGWCLQAGYSQDEANSVTMHFVDSNGNSLGDISPTDYMREDGISPPGG